MPPTKTAIALSGPLTLNVAVDVSATGCPDDSYLNFHVLNAQGTMVIGMGGAQADGTFGPVPYTPTVAGPYEFRIVGSKYDHNGYPSGPWKTLASVDANVQ